MNPGARQQGAEPQGLAFRMPVVAPDRADRASLYIRCSPGIKPWK